MAEETLGSYLNHILAFSIFLVISLFIFLVLYLVAKKTKDTGTKITFFKKDPFMFKNLFVLAMVFVSTILFFFLVSNTILLISEFEFGRPFYLMAGILFLFLLISVYIVKSRILSKEMT